MQDEMRYHIVLSIGSQTHGVIQDYTIAMNGIGDPIARENNTIYGMG